MNIPLQIIQVDGIFCLGTLSFGQQTQVTYERLGPCTKRGTTNGRRTQQTGKGEKCNVVFHNASLVILFHLIFMPPDLEDL